VAEAGAAEGRGGMKWENIQWMSVLLSFGGQVMWLVGGIWGNAHMPLWAVFVAFPIWILFVNIVYVFIAIQKGSGV
jgi:hypothetical protein